MELFHKLFNHHKVYVVPGSEFCCEQFGWFRIVISVEPNQLDAGLVRIKSALFEDSKHEPIMEITENPLKISFEKLNFKEKLQKWKKLEELKGRRQ